MAPRASLNISLPALRTFEAVARLGGLAPAADELGMTISAVSQQLKAIERAAASPLLEKRGRQLVLTAAGAMLAGKLMRPFAEIDRAVAEARGNRAVLTISAHDTFTAHWLLPRIRLFDDLCPGIDVRLATTARLVDLDRELVDCAIRLGPGGWPGVDAVPLVQQQLAPMVRVDQRHARPRSRVVQEGAADAWQQWRELPPFDRDLTVSSRDLVINAVLGGVGVGLVDIVIMADRIISGDLVPVGCAQSTTWSYHFLLPKRRRATPAVAQFVEWLAAELRRTNEILAQCLDRPWESSSGMPG